jgi:hypothetical protein
MAGGVLAVAAPAGLAFADTPGDTVGRPDGNLAPGVRAAQAIGDATFNYDTPLSKAINGSPLGTAYHKAFGQRGKPIVDANGNVTGYEKNGTEGYIKGALNAPPGIVVGTPIPLRECNIKVASGSLFPTGIQGGKC